MSPLTSSRRLLILSSDFPYPVDIGRKAVLAGFLEFAVEALGRENVVLLSVCSGHDEQRAARLSPCRVEFFPLSPAPVRLGAAGIQSLLLRRRAIQEMLVGARGSAGPIANCIERFDPDTIFLDTIRVVQHLPSGAHRRYRCVLNLDDLYSLRYRRTLEAIARYPEAAIDPVGTFARFLPAPMRKLARAPRLQRSLLALESSILASRERAMPGLFDQVLLLNEAEAVRLREATGAKNIVSLRPLIRRRTRVHRSFAGRATFLFLGNLRYSPNAYALLLFLQRAMPKLLEMRPDAELLVAGTGADPALQNLCGRFGEHVRLLDYVEDLESLTSSCACMIVPLVFGSGIKIKVIEALSRGVPLVSTSWGIDGLDLADGVHCLVEDDIAAFPAAMLGLLDPALKARFSEAAEAYFAGRLSSEAVRGDYLAAILGDGVAGSVPQDRPAA